MPHLYHPRSFRPLHALIAGACLLCLCPAKAQFFSTHSTTAWLKPAWGAITHSDSVFIGNYYAIDPSRANTPHTLKTAAGKQKGTLFLTLGTTDSLTEDPLLRFGRIQLFRTYILVAGDTLKLNKDLGKAPGIVRISYSRFSGNRHFPGIVEQAPGTYLTELIHFEDVLPQEAIRKVESYLALKYSINITENPEAELRNYINGQDEKLWNVYTDALFDKEVLALGRIDSLGFYQTQTYTADAENIRVSLDSVSPQGAMPPAELTDKAMLVLSKNAFSPELLRCGDAPGRRQWKLRFKDWQYWQGKLYITLNEVLAQKDYPILTNGQSRIPVEVKTIGSTTRIAIPLQASLQQSDHFLVWGARGIQCTPLCQVNSTSCTETAPGSIAIDIDPEALPAEVALYNLATDQWLRETVYEPKATIENLNSGQYQLTVESGERQLADQLFILEDCPANPLDARGDILAASPVIQTGNEDTTPSGGASQRGTGSASPYTLSQQTPVYGIRAYPNPAFSATKISFSFEGLEDRDFTIALFDDAGSHIASTRFTPTEEAPLFSYDFKLPGTYFVRFNTADYSDYIKVVINN